MPNFCWNLAKQALRFPEITVNCAEKKICEQEMKTIFRYEETIYYIFHIHKIRYTKLNFYLI